MDFGRKREERVKGRRGHDYDRIRYPEAMVLWSIEGVQN